MFRSIVVPLDGSPFAEQALPHACTIATRAQAELQLIHVHTPSASPLYVADQPVIDENIGSLHHQHEQLYLERIQARLAAQMPDLAITVKAYDRPLESIVNESVGEFLAEQISAQADVDLIVMTTHGRGGWSRLWLGSVADVLVRLSHVPILLVRPQEGEVDMAHLPTYQNILIPLDGSSLAETVLEPAQRLGALMAAEYTLLQVVPSMPVAYGLSPQQLGAANDQAMQRAQAYLAGVAQRRAQPGQHIHSRVVNRNDVVAAILEDAQHHHNDLIALATHGWSGLRRFLLGSVADKVVRSATQPVLLYRPQAQ